jgi:hypothetical protein
VGGRLRHPPILRSSTPSHSIFDGLGSSFCHDRQHRHRPVSVRAARTWSCIPEPPGTDRGGKTCACAQSRRSLSLGSTSKGKVRPTSFPTCVGSAFGEAYLAQVASDPLPRPLFYWGKLGECASFLHVNAWSQSRFIAKLADLIGPWR